jgi:hypothetical protein
MKKPNKNFRADFNQGNTTKLREKLLREISDYQRQLTELKMEQNQVSFSKIQTLKDLIKARETMLRYLPNQTV